MIILIWLKTKPIELKKRHIHEHEHNHKQTASHSRHSANNIKCFIFKSHYNPLFNHCYAICIQEIIASLSIVDNFPVVSHRLLCTKYWEAKDESNKPKRYTKCVNVRKKVVFRRHFLTTWLLSFFNTTVQSDFIIRAQNKFYFPFGNL